MKLGEWDIDKMLPLGSFLLLSILCQQSLAADERDSMFFSETADVKSEAEQMFPITQKGDYSNKVSDEAVTIGGTLFFQNDLQLAQHQSPTEARLNQRALLFLYLDQRPSTESRLFIKGSLLQPLSQNGNQSIDEMTLYSRPPARIEELWIKLNLARRIFMTFGIQPIRWGVGRIWNPTDFLNQRQRDPLAIFDNRPGVATAKFHFPVEETGTNLYAFVLPNEVGTLGALGYALRLEQVLGPSEVSLSADFNRHNSAKYAGSISLGIGPIDLRSEIATSKQSNAARWQGLFDLEAGSLPTRKATQNWPLQWTTGVEWGVNYADTRSFFLTVEYFYNELGYDNNAQLYPWLLTQGDYVPLYIGKSYLGTNLTFPGLGATRDHSISLSQIANLSDRTAIMRLDHRIAVLTRLQLSTYLAYFMGDQGEFYYPYTIPSSVTGDIDLKIEPPRLSLGVWLSSSF